MDIDNSVNVSKPSEGNVHTSKEAFHTEMARGFQPDTAATRGLNEIGTDGMTRADRNFFTNWGSLTDEVGVQRALQEITSNLNKLKNFPADLDVALKELIILVKKCKSIR
ncbi:MAG: hypothetical protein CM15mV125_370 [uncultured marine virus]|nr:MAG: hypothetical protein CM15mV125_370 [uncultured marine virus]